MPVTNADSSNLTRVRRAMALNAYQAQQAAAVQAGTSVRKEQNSDVTLDVVVARNQGGCYCAASGNYERNS